MIKLTELDNKIEDSFPEEIKLVRRFYFNELVKDMQ